MATHSRILVAVLLGALGPLSAGAQEPQPGSVSPPLVEAHSDFQIGRPAGPPPTPEHTGIVATLRDLVADVCHLPSRQNLFWVGVGSAAALAVHPADDNLNAHLVGSNSAHNVFVAGAYMGNSPALLGAAGAIYATGRLRDNKHVSHIGSDLLQSVALAEAMSQTLKVTTRRERPDGSGRNSFPSGHAADTFAFATALERHLGWKGAVPAYLFSSYVAMSRLHDNRHYVSDVAFGSAVGIIAGRTVTRHGRQNYSVQVVPVRGGAEVMFARLAQQN